MCKTYLSLLIVKAYIPFQCFCHMSPSALSVTRHGRPYDAVTQLREIPTCKSPFSKCIWHGGGGVTTWVPTLEPQLLSHSPWKCFCPPHIPCMQITPWDVAHSWVVSVPVVLYRWCVLPRSHASCTDTPRVESLPAGTGGVAWKPPFSSIITVLGYRGTRPPCPYCAASYYAASLLCRPLHGNSYPWVSGGGTTQL